MVDYRFKIEVTDTIDNLLLLYLHYSNSLAVLLIQYICQSS